MLTHLQTTPVITTGTRPYITVVIPSLNGNVIELLNRLKEQTWSPDEILVVQGIKPNGRARNSGVAQIRGPKDNCSDYILVFIDDDALPGQSNLIESLLQPLLDSSDLKTTRIGVTGVARILPKDASLFEKRVAAEIPRTVNDVPSRPLVTNPPLGGYGHSLITTTCCAMWKSTYADARGFSDDLTSGVDTDFFYRVRRIGFEFIMVPEVFVEHPAPQTLKKLWKKFYWYGKGYAQETRQRPEQKMGFRLRNPIARAVFLIGATLWLIPNIFFLYSFGYPRFEVGFRPLKAFSTYAVAWGYVAGWKVD